MEIVVTYRRTSRLSMRIGCKGEVRVSAPYGLPREEVERFVAEHGEWIGQARSRTRERLERRRAFFAQLPLDTRAGRRDAVNRLDAIVRPLVERHAREMGVQPSSITYGATISRWGCCRTRERSIQFSVFLLLPEWCIEHVVVHELAHLIVPGHGPAFHAVMDRHFPLWREARLETRRVSRMEEDGM